MKKIILLAASAAVLALLVSCQQQEPDASNAGQELVPVTLSASFDAIDTKVSYEEEDTGSNYLLKPLWEKGTDSVIGFDENGNKYTFTVSDVVDGVATLSGDAPASCTLHLIYLCGATAEGITDSGISVSYASQSGDKTMPAVMLADGAVAYGTGNFEFHNAGAVIGVKAVKGVPDGSSVSSITVSGENLSAATIALDGSSLKLTATENADDAISTASLSDVTVTDANGTLSQLVLIAVPAEAVVNNVSVATDNGAFGFTLASPSTLAANQYSYVAGQKFAEKVSVSLVANIPGSGSFMIDGEATPSKTVNSGTEITIKAIPEEGYCFVKWSDGVTDATRTICPSEDVVYQAVFAEMVTITVAPTEFGKITINGEDVSSLQVASGEEVELKATTGSTFKFVKWGEDGNTDATRTVTVTEDITYTPYFGVGVDYVEIGGIKWATQNLSISESGNRYWTRFTYPNDRKIFVNGDYFQWAAYSGYCGNTTDADKGLLLYSSFTSTACGDVSNAFTFKSGKQFNKASAPYSNGELYSAYLGSGSGKASKRVLEPEDDVASIIKGGSWRMPSSEEFRALKQATHWAWDIHDGGFYVFSPDATHEAGKCSEVFPNDLNKYDALLFFPAAGSYISKTDFKYIGYYCGYWANCLYSITYSNFYEFAEELMYSGNNNVPAQIFHFARFYGQSVRPVSD